MKRHQNRLLVANSKGGVGKSTTVLEIAAHASNMGKKILIIDFDSQGNSTRSLLGKLPSPSEDTIFDALVKPNFEIKDIIKKASVSWKNVFLIPCNQKLSQAYKFLEPDPSWVTKLDEIVESIESNFDLIIIDTGPTMSMLTQMAMRASNKLLIPTDPSIFGEDGIETILGMKNFMEKKLKHKIKIYNIILTASHKKTSISSMDAIEKIQKTYGDIFLDINIPHSVKVNEAQRLNTPPKSAMSLLKEDHPLYKGYKELTKYYFKEQS